MKIIDLTLPLYTGMPVFPGDPEVAIDVIQTHAKEGWEMRRIHINGHDGTHVNLPIHMVAGGKNLDDYTLGNFCGRARMYTEGEEMSSEFGYIFRNQNINAEIAEQIKAAKPRFVGLSSDFEFDVPIETDLLAAGIISFERLANTKDLPDEFMFYGMPLNIRSGDGSPVRAFAVID